MPVILATREVEVEGWSFEAGSKKLVKNLSQKISCILLHVTSYGLGGLGRKIMVSKT
jgi:hypothetical protein